MNLRSKPDHIFRHSLICVFIICSSLGAAAKPRRSTLKDYNLALTPPMGWNSWNHFGCDVNEALVREMADALVSSGMKAVGYEYVVVDDCWQIDRDRTGNIIADPNRFPSGMKALADYVHALGLKFGIYSCAGRQTCQKRPGSRGHEFQDARQYAAWGVDYLKYDWCNHGFQNARASYETMAEALMNSGRPIVFSICEWGENEPWKWGRLVGQLWRTTGDIVDCYDCTEMGGSHLGWTLILDKQVGLEKYARPGAWNDPDMLEVGNGGMNNTEYQAHFSMWCMLSAPLMAGNDLRNMGPQTVEILTNVEAIAVNQDRLGKQAKKVRDEGDLEVWLKALADGHRAVALLNRSNKRRRMSVTWPEIGLKEDQQVHIRDLWTFKERSDIRGNYSAEVPGHGVVLLRLY
jgi:alpha-galactosidase